MFLCLLLLSPFEVLAQIAGSGASNSTPVELPENLTREQVRDLVARLSDDQVRQLIIDQLDKNALAAETANDAEKYFEQLSMGLHTAHNAVSQLFTSGDRLHAMPGMVWTAITQNGEVSGGYLLFQLIGLIVAGLIFERIARHLLRGAAARKLESVSFSKRFNLACFGGAMGLIELGAFALGAFLLVEVSGRNTPAATLLWHQTIICLVMIKLVMLGAHLVTSPDNADLRLASVTDSTARQIWGWTLLLTASLFLPLPVVETAVTFGADAETELLLRVLFSGFFMLVVVGVVIRLRNHGARLIAGDDAHSGGIRQGLARIWWMLTIVYILMIWLLAMGKRAATGESTLLPGLGSLLMFAAIPYLDRGLRWVIIYYFASKEEETAEAAVDEAKVESSELTVANAGSRDAEIVAEVEPEIESGYQVTALRYARILMMLAILAIFVRLWNIDVQALTGLLVGGRFSGALFDIGITILLAWALWGVIRISIERKLEEERGPESDTEEAEAGGLGGTRTETILPLIRVFIKITLIVMTVMVCLSALGVNIGPLLAGAGVVGIAIGFGAQTLVRDIVSGFFYLLDDAFRIGEYVVIDQIRGTVEKISIRSFQLRHHNGPVHTIPYGEIRTLTNWSRDWAIMKFELRIPFETDIEKVRKLIKQIGIGMLEDPIYGPLMLQPLKSQGVNRMDDSALIIRCKFTAIPGQQYLIRREAFTRIQREFEKEGIHFAPRRVLVEATTPQEATRAAAGALDQEIIEGGEGGAGKSDQM